MFHKYNYKKINIKNKNSSEGNTFSIRLLQLSHIFRKTNLHIHYNKHLILTDKQQTKCVHKSQENTPQQYSYILYITKINQGREEELSALCA